MQKKLDHSCIWSSKKIQLYILSHSILKIQIQFLQVSVHWDRGRAVKCRFTELLFSEFALMFVTTSFTAHSPNHFELLCVEPARQDIKPTVILTACSWLWYLRVFCAGGEIGLHCCVGKESWSLIMCGAHVLTWTFMFPVMMEYSMGCQSVTENSSLHTAAVRGPPSPGASSSADRGGIILMKTWIMHCKFCFLMFVSFQNSQHKKSNICFLFFGSSMVKLKSTSW